MKSVRLQERGSALQGGVGTVDVRLPGKEDSNSHGARLVHLVTTMMKWFWNSRLSINNSLDAVENVVADSCEGLLR